MVESTEFQYFAEQYIMLPKSGVIGLARLARILTATHSCGLCVFALVALSPARTTIHESALEGLWTDIVVPILMFFVWGCFLPVLYLLAIRAAHSPRCDDRT